jgi:hypothetical protein
MNHSNKKDKMFELIKCKNMDQDIKSFSFANDNGDIHISFEKLFKFNEFLNLTIIDDEKNSESDE